jgi:tRNA(Ile)-lysidine synthase
MDILRDIAHALAGLPAGRLLVGFSGGMDSTVLLHALAALPEARARDLRAIHVDHGLQPDSRRWAEHCAGVCAGLGIPILVQRVQVTVEGEGPEGAARRARWQAFREQAGHDDIIVLAHHRDDQAETVLLRLLRGAGPTGLAAMRMWSERDDGLRVWRPLLATPRAGLERHARHAGLAWLDDPGNATGEYDRNHLRHDILPALRPRWPQVDAVLAQAAERMADAQALELAVAGQWLARATTLRPEVLALAPLSDAPRPQRWATLRLWLQRLGVPDTGAARLAQIDREVIGAAIDADPRLLLGTHVLRRFQGHLHLLQAGADSPLEYRIDWDGRGVLALPDGSRLALDPPPVQPLPLRVSSRRGGERLRVHEQGPRRELRLLFQELRVPTWERARWPVIWQAGEAVAFADVVLAGAFARQLEAQGMSLRFTPAGAPR